MKSFFIVVVLMLRNGGAQTRIGGAPRAKESDNCSIRIFSAELCYLMVNEWIDNTGTEDFMGQDLLCVPVWKYDYSLVDKDGANADMGSIFLRADTGELADLWDDKIIAQIHSPG